jgi:hypothetical protein
MGKSRKGEGGRGKAEGRAQHLRGTTLLDELAAHTTCAGGMSNGDNRYRCAGVKGRRIFKERARLSERVESLRGGVRARRPFFYPQRCGLRTDDGALCGLDSSRSAGDFNEGIWPLRQGGCLLRCGRKGRILAGSWLLVESSSVGSAHPTWTFSLPKSVMSPFQTPVPFSDSRLLTVYKSVFR